MNCTEFFDGGDDQVVPWAMDSADTKSTTSADKLVPPTPLKTYRWEDVRRSKLKGGYPWTYLQKEPYNEHIDPEEFTMDYFRRSKSASTLGTKSESGVVIEEITETEEKEKKMDEINEAQKPSAAIDLADSSGDDNVSQYLDKDESAQNLNLPGSSKEEKSTLEIPRNGERQERAKSEEPKRKRKLSIESSYSRISMKSFSKLGVMKRLKEAKDKIKLPKFASLTKLDKKQKKNKTKSEKDLKITAKKEPKNDNQTKDQKPVYIHIPLKPPPGETDEFSKFAEEGTSKETSKTEPSTENEEQKSEEEKEPSSVQLIILTAPSDDEILDSASTPNTPTEVEKTNIYALKSLAKDIADEISPETKSNEHLNVIVEERSSEEKEEDKHLEEKMEITEIPDEDTVVSPKKDNKIEPSNKPDDVYNKRDEISVPIEENKAPEKLIEKIMVDEEDGLKLSDQAIALINEELAKENLPKIEEAEIKSSLKETSGSPAVKKRVSFKRKAKIDGDYEDVQPPKDEKVSAAQSAEITQSMSVDEEKTYLDDKIIKSASLEEDYNKWSKNTDHEYEPVNPPPETEKPPVVVATHEKQTTITSSGPRHVRIPLHDEVVVSSDEADTVETAQNLQDRLEAHFNLPPQSEPKLEAPQAKPEEASPRKDSKSTMLTQIEGQGKKIKDAFNTQTGKFKTKLQSIKKPNISMPSKPTFDKSKMQKIKNSMPKIQKPKLTMPKMPKMPEKSKINFPSFSLPRKGTTKSKLKQRQFSTESNAGDSKNKLFDFSTYPRIFKRKKANDDLDQELPESATVPRTKTKSSLWTHKKVEESKMPKEETKKESPVYIRIPLHSEESLNKMDALDIDPNIASHTRYNEDIDIEDAYRKENQEIHRASPFSSKYVERWKHGTFHAQASKKEPRNEPDVCTDLDHPEEYSPPNGHLEQRAHSSGSSGDIHRRGVLEEINPDEFFLRQKGISQDNIEVGMYLSSEIREAFKNPTNSLTQMQDDSYDRDYEVDISDQSLDESPKRKPIRKPKRKRTPHVSQEKIAYDQESVTTEPEEYPKVYDPAKPKRRSKKYNRDRHSKTEEIIPYQETIPVDEPEGLNFREISPENRPRDHQMYENGHMEGIEQPEIKISNPYQREFYNKNLDRYLDEADFEPLPQVPTRRHRSLKSLSASEHDSITGEFAQNKDFAPETIEAYRMEHEYIIPTPELEPPVRPVRSRTRSQSHTNSNLEDDLSRGSESITSENQMPCVEPTCVKDLRDSMGYAIIDKKRQRDPPLPPPRFVDHPKTPPPRRRRGKQPKDGETKFFTVPRPLNDAPPVRPLRNYSTLGLPRKKRSIQNLTDEEKENVDLSQYSEIQDDEHGRNLQSGEVVQKMKDRPLPAPPRPPRRPRGVKTLHDITNHDNRPSNDNLEKTIVEEAETSTQTEPLPDDFVCEEPIQERHDRILTPNRSFEETITHGSLVVQPIDDATILPSSQLSRERIVPITREEHFYENEFSEIPEEFHKLQNPPTSSIHDTHINEPVIERPILLPQNTEVETLKAQKLQVGDLDVDRLTVNELLASKIKVSEIDSNNIQVSEINSQSGNLIVSGIELPASFLQELVDKLQNTAKSEEQEQNPHKPEESNKQDEQKKTPIEKEVEPPHRPPRLTDLQKSTENLETPHEESVEDIPEKPQRSRIEDPRVEVIEDESNLEQIEHIFVSQAGIFMRMNENDDETPDRPPRYRSDTSKENEMETLQQETPPPRPPQPFDVQSEDFIYLPSQPPPSFYSLHSPMYAEFIDDDIPHPPRRRRHQKLNKTSSSEEVLPTVRRSRHRTPESSIPQLTCQLTKACASEAERQLKRLITYITNYVLDNADGKQDLHVMVVMLLVLIAGLILMGFGDGKTVHLHHWEYFNPPKNL